MEIEYVRAEEFFKDSVPNNTAEHVRQENERNYNPFNSDERRRDLAWSAIADKPL